MIGFTDKQKMCLDVFNKNLPTWLNDALKKNKYAVICEDGIRAIYDTVDSAVDYAYDHLDMGSYIIQRIIDENELAGVRS